jgi:hypothetical protein
VIHGGKDVENRTAPRQFKAAVGERIFVYASKPSTSAPSSLWPVWASGARRSTRFSLAA